MNADSRRLKTNALSVFIRGSESHFNKLLTRRPLLNLSFEVNFIEIGVLRLGLRRVEFA
jgi:hypothetical protein